MGQYYTPYLQIYLNNGHILQEPLNVNLGGLKLTEHSWMGNFGVQQVVEKIYETQLNNSVERVKLYWIGDYAEQDELSKLDCIMPLENILNAETEPLESKMLLNRKFIVNDTKREYIDCDLFASKSFHESLELTYNPLSLLTAVGNQRGGGDYYGINEKFIGIYAGDDIRILDKPPEDYTLFDIYFNEESEFKK